jgi:acetylornithine aminotransferase
MAKGMGNGFPIGGILIAPHLSPKHGMLGTTFGGNHLACAAALGVLEVMEAEHLLAKAKESGEYIMSTLQTIQGLENVRGKGLMIGFEVSEGLKGLRKVLLDDYHVFTGEAKPNVVRLLPALTIERKHIDEFFVALRAAVAQLSGETPVAENKKVQA